MINKDLMKLLGDGKKYIGQAVVWMVLGLLMSLGITAAICGTIAAALTQQNSWITGIFIAVILVAARWICSVKAGDAKEKIGAHAKKQLRQMVYDKLLRLGVNREEDMHRAGLTQMALEGVEQLDLYYSTYIPQFFYAMIAPLVLFLVTVWLDWRMAAVLLACVPLIPLSIMAVSRYAKKIFAKYWGKYTSMGDTFLDSVQGLKELKIFDADARQHEKMDQSAEEFRKITMKVLVMQLASVTIMDLVAYGGAGLGIAISVHDAAIGRILPLTGLFLVLTAVEFFLPLRAFGSAFHVAMNGVSAGKKILTLLDQEEPVWGKEQMQQANIDMENVQFSYDGSKEVLQDINLHFPDHGLYAIVGRSGCGKSTIVSLLLGSIRPQSGTIALGGKPLVSYDRQNYYDHLCYVSSNTFVFHTSIRQNFQMAKPDITDEEIYAALKRVNLLELTGNENGLDYVIAEDAQNISGGQKQRLALAVNLTVPRDIYIFDEATSNIDVESEAIIMQVLHEIAAEKLVILISHRLANVVDADGISYMENGRIQESGTHDILMNKNGGYAAMYRTQQQLEKGYLEVMQNG